MKKNTVSTQKFPIYYFVIEESGYRYNVPSELLKLLPDEVGDLLLFRAVGVGVLELGATVLLQTGIESFVEVVAVVFDGGGHGLGGGEAGMSLERLGACCKWSQSVRLLERRDRLNRAIVAVLPCSC